MVPFDFRVQKYDFILNWQAFGGFFLRFLSFFSLDGIGLHWAAALHFMAGSSILAWTFAEVRSQNIIYIGSGFEKIGHLFCYLIN